MKKDFLGKTVVVTGASAGLGRAMVREFAKHGANVGLIARGIDGLNATKKEVGNYTWRTAYKVSKLMSRYHRKEKTIYGNHCPAIMGPMELLMLNHGVLALKPGWQRIKKIYGVSLILWQ